MKKIFIIFAIISIFGIIHTTAQCTGIPVKKRQEECCDFNKLFSADVMMPCKEQYASGNKKTSRKQGEAFKGNCAVECAFNVTESYINGQLRSDQIIKTFSTAMNGDSALIAILKTAVNKCLPIAENRTTEFIASVTSGVSDCSPLTWYFYLCVKDNMVKDCPADKFKSNDPDCITMKNYFTQCSTGPS